MTAIRAFVGHSFTQDDEAVVQKFLNYFDTIAGMNSGFEWVHAKRAAPKELSEKVLELMDGKNLFIGICTKKEIALDYSNMKVPLLDRTKFLIKKDEIKWKTSDWVIQEIGIAFGRGLHLILLIESGVRQPGGIQGNLEYIEFDRESPEAKFPAFLEMITSLMPKIGQVYGTSDVGQTLEKPQEQLENEEESFLDRIKSPLPTWEQKDYELAVFHFLLERNDEGVRGIIEAATASATQGSGINPTNLIAYEERTRIRYGKGGSIAKIENISRQNPDNSLVLGYLADSYDFYKKYKEAAENYNNASEKEEEGSRAIYLKSLSAISYEKAGEHRLSRMVMDEIRRLSRSDNESNALFAAKAYFEHIKSSMCYVSVLEKIIEMDPSNIDARFSLAYKYSEIGNDDLALFHYLEIPSQERDSTSWNNLGVAYSKFRIHSKSVDAFRISEERGETLAMSNLAYRLMNAGFLEEAKAECNKGLSMENYNDNITSALGRLREIPKEENESVEDIVDRAQKKSEFLRKAGRAVTVPDVLDIPSEWSGPDYELHVSINGGKFHAVGQYERAENAMANALAGVFGAKNSPQVINVEWSGSVTGHFIEAEISEEKKGGGRLSASLLGDITKKILIVIDDDGETMNVVEQYNADRPRYYSLSARNL